MFYYFFFFNDTATTEIYTLSLHDALPIYAAAVDTRNGNLYAVWEDERFSNFQTAYRDRKSTRLNSSHGYISYAVFCLKKKKQMNHRSTYIQHKNDPDRNRAIIDIQHNRST